MTETPKDSLSPTSLADLDEESPFNLAYKEWRRGNSSPLTDYVTENGIRTQWERETLATMLELGNSLKMRKNSTENAVLRLRLYSQIRDALNLSWDEIYRRIAKKIHPDGDTLQIEALTDALKKLRSRYKIK